MIQAIKLSKQNSKHDFTHDITAASGCENYDRSTLTVSLPREQSCLRIVEERSRKWDKKPAALVIWMRLWMTWVTLVVREDDYQVIVTLVDWLIRPIYWHRRSSRVCNAHGPSAVGAQNLPDVVFFHVKLTVYKSKFGNSLIDYENRNWRWHIRMLLADS